MQFINDNFLLSNPTAEALYHEYAKGQPIIDYHCHLPQKDVADNRRFNNLFEIWLEGDHYKWRVMRSNGMEERLCTGDASPKEKFDAFAASLPMCLRNPMYHWSHLELKRYFGIDTLLNPQTADAIWEQANAQLAESADLTAQGILRKFDVRVVCTTDDPTDDLADHQRIAESGLPTKVFPTFRPDKAMACADVAAWNAWTDKLAAICDERCADLASFKDALAARHAYFHSMGGRLSDHGLETCPSRYADKAEAGGIYAKLRAGTPVSAAEADAFAGHLMLFFGELDSAKNWTKQLHLGAMRNVNLKLFGELGPDIGCDSIGDFAQGRTLAAYLGRLAANSTLPKTILYNLNPRDNYLFATMIGNFQDGGIAGKMQFGSGWWFLDQKEGMTWQLNALSNLGLLGRFVGMLTDSRSFMSYCRHEYFRRLLCQLIGEDVERGELPRDMDLLGDLVRRISYGNAAEFFGFPQ